MWATWFWRWRCAVTRRRAWRKLLAIRCIAVQKRAVQFTKKPYLPLFSSETADKFARDYTIEKSFRHALRLVTAHLHRQNQVAHALHTRDFWLASLSIHFPIHFTRRAHEYPVTLSVSVPFPFRSVQITLTMCTCSYTVEYRSVLSPFRKFNTKVTKSRNKRSVLWTILRISENVERATVGTN